MQSTLRMLLQEQEDWILLGVIPWVIFVALYWCLGFVLLLLELEPLRSCVARKKFQPGEAWRWREVLDMVGNKP